MVHIAGPTHAQRSAASTKPRSWTGSHFTGSAEMSRGANQCTQHGLFLCVWSCGQVPACGVEIRHCSENDCWMYKPITLLSVHGKVYAHRARSSGEVSATSDLRASLSTVRMHCWQVHNGCHFCLETPNGYPL